MPTGKDGFTRERIRKKAVLKYRERKPFKPVPNSPVSILPFRGLFIGKVQLVREPVNY